jgi:hypothetical protein
LKSFKSFASPTRHPTSTTTDAETYPNLALLIIPLYTNNVKAWINLRKTFLRRDASISPKKVAFTDDLCYYIGYESIETAFPVYRALHTIPDGGSKP